MTKTILVSMAIMLYQVSHIQAQQLKPGFDPEEYRELMMLSVRTTASPNYIKDFPEPKKFKMAYQSAPMGLDNLWDLWFSENKVAVISIRGTTKKPESWLANFYAAMVPATGEMIIGEKDTFRYQLASNPKAAVHAGWLLSTAFLSKDMLPKIRDAYQDETRDIIITGHSQGGAICFILTAYLYNLQKQGALPADIRFKTYASAGPKPGNLFFAYEYEAMTQNGWAFNVVNAADWVPQTPISIQTVDDFVTTNPFDGAKPAIKKQKFPLNIVLNHVYNQLSQSTVKARNKYEKYMGRILSKMIQKNLKDHESPLFYHSMDYVRTGTTITLIPDEDYFKKFPDDPKNVFVHHLHTNYLYLLAKAQISKPVEPLLSVTYKSTDKELQHLIKSVTPSPIKKYFLHSQAGIQAPSFNHLNEALQSAGFKPLQRVYFSRGGGFYTVFPSTRITSLFNYSTYSSINQAGSFSNAVRGTAVGTSFGYSLLKSPKKQLIPYAGIVYSWFGARVSKDGISGQNFNGYLNGPANQQYILTKGFIGNAGIQYTIRPFMQKNADNNIFLGLRSGFHARLGKNKWTTNGQKLSDGPTVNPQGFYANMVIGLAL